jgi:hypothetical protein
MDARGKHGAFWSQDDLAKLKLLDAERIPLQQMAIELGRTQASVAAMRTKLRRPASQTPRTDPVTKRSSRRRNGASFFLS